MIEFRDGQYCFICDKCKIYLCPDDGTYEGQYNDQNFGQECTSCKKKRQNAYDDFVDPLHAYH